MSYVNDVNLSISVITGHVNTKLYKCLSLHKEKTERCETNSLKSAFYYSQLINKSTHLTKKSSTCMDQILATSPNLTEEIVVELSVFENCHYNLIYGIIDFMVPLPARFFREVWNYKDTSVNHI